jgi:hypothetical protein
LSAMFSFQTHPIAYGLLAAKPYDGADENGGRRFIGESQPQYLSRHPERSDFYQLFETHFDTYVRVYEERFEAQIENLSGAAG